MTDRAEAVMPTPEQIAAMRPKAFSLVSRIIQGTPFEAEVDAFAAALAAANLDGWNAALDTAAAAVAPYNNYHEFVCLDGGLDDLILALKEQTP